MKDCRILKSIKSGRGHISFHTPGHKGGGALGGVLKICAEDVTELSYTDDLSSPYGPIAEAQADIAMICGAKRAFITTDGSTSGVLSMLYAVKDRGGKIIVPRNSHVSVWNACRLLGIEPVIVQGEERGGVLLPPDGDKVGELAAKDGDIIGMIAVSPDYYGNIAPLEKYAEAMHACGKVLLVDGAHKSLPALTQGAAVLINDLSLEEGIRQGLGIFRTTSPSYPIMASVEFAYKYLDARPEDIARAKQAAAQFRERFPDFRFYHSADWTKLCLDCAASAADSRIVAEKLEKSGIYAEFADGRYVVFYLSPATTAVQLIVLGRRLTKIFRSRGVRGTYVPAGRLPAPARTYSYLYALSRPSEFVEPEQAVGRMAACNAGLMPPCIPVVAAGEIISEEAARALKGAHTFGLKDGKIQVVIKNEG